MEAFFNILKDFDGPFSFVVIISLFSIIGILIYTCYTAYLDFALKRDMVHKGMSAEDIERVINAGKDKPEIENETSEHRA